MIGKGELWHMKEGEAQDNTSMEMEIIMHKWKIMDKESSAKSVSKTIISTL